MRRTTKGGSVIEAILILAGFALLAKAAMAGASTFKLIGAGEPVEGVITAIEDKGFTADIEFTADQGVAVVFAETGPFLNHQIGDRVPVIYDVTNPVRAMVDKVTVLWFIPFALAIPGFLLLALGFRLRGGRNL